MKYSILVPHDFNVEVRTKEGTTICFECDLEYSHSHSVECSGIQSVAVIDPVTEKGNIIEPDDVFYDRFVRAGDEEPIKMAPVEREPKVSLTSRLHEEIATKSEDDSDYSVFQNVVDEPENLGKDFLRAQLSTKNQAIIRNILAIASAVSVCVVFILEKLGVL